MMSSAIQVIIWSSKSIAKRITANVARKKHSNIGHISSLCLSYNSKMLQASFAFMTFRP